MAQCIGVHPEPMKTWVNVYFRMGTSCKGAVHWGIGKGVMGQAQEQRKISCKHECLWMIERCVCPFFIPSPAWARVLEPKQMGSA